MLSASMNLIEKKLCLKRGVGHLKDKQKELEKTEEAELLLF